MKFCAGWFDGEIWLNQTHEGTSFGVYEISAKNNNVPTKSKMRAKTSLQALCLSVRATASDSNSMLASFNHKSHRHLACGAFGRLLNTSFERGCAMFPSAFCNPSSCRKPSAGWKPTGPTGKMPVRPTRFHSCTQHQRLITVPAHYGFFPSPGRRCCFALHLSVFYILRKASDWSDAGSPTRTARSSKGLVRLKETF